MPRSEITAMIQRARGMVEYVRENLTEEELKVFLDEIAPLPEPEQSVKKPRKKVSKKSTSKSPRASSLGTTIKGNLEQRREAKDGACTYVLESGAVCNTGDNNPIHDKLMGYAGYHEFQTESEKAMSA
jgi:hypothetical protein